MSIRTLKTPDAKAIASSTSIECLSTDGSSDPTPSSSYNDNQFTTTSFPSSFNDSSLVNSLTTISQVGDEPDLSDSKAHLFQAASKDKLPNWSSHEHQFRRDYIDRLIMMKIMKPNRTCMHHQTVTIFDWDDTFLSTSFIYHIGLAKASTSPEAQTALRKLDKTCYKVLEKVLRAGKTYIVTNASKNWVETSSRVYLPATSQLIERNNITIVSAREEYERKYPEEPSKWKSESFVALSRQFNKSIFTNIICVGDSDSEVQAAQGMGKEFDNALVKTIKFKQQPKPCELIKQLELVYEKFGQIYTTLRSLTIKLEKKAAL